MKNKEKYAKELAGIPFSELAMTKDGKICRCKEILCRDCAFYERKFPFCREAERIEAVVHTEIARLTAERNDSKIEYHGYHAYVRYSAADKVLYGKIEGIKDLVDFESESAAEIENEFHKAVDDYIAFCKEIGKNVEKENKA